MRPTHRFTRTLASCLLAGCGVASAQTDGGGIELTQTRAAALAPASPTQPAVELAEQTMLWQHRGAVAFGVGVEQRAAVPQTTGLQPRNGADAILVGVSLATGLHSRLSWQTTVADGAAAPLAHRPMQLTLTFERSDTLRHLRRGSLLRMELSGQTTLALRARGGRLGLALTSRW